MGGVAEGRRQWLKIGRAAVLCLTAALCWCVGAAATEDHEEVSLADVKQAPYIYIIAPMPGATYDSARELTVKVGGENVSSFEVELSTDEERLFFSAEGKSCEHTFVFSEAQTTGAALVVRGYGEAGQSGDAPVTELSMAIPSPKQELIEKMIALAYDNSKDSRYKFAPAQEDWDIGVCKNFVMRLFDTYAKGYRMREYPDIPLHMPVNNSKKACAPYDYGIEWKPETAAEGSPFEIAAQFKYDESLTLEENAQLARKLLVQIKKGDFFQIVGYYGGGNGPHSMYIIRDYNPETEMIHWTDSNMSGTRVDGARWGYMQFNADAEVDWWVEVFNMKKRGATLYRLRDDLIIWK